MLTVAQCIRHIEHTLDTEDFGVEGAVGLINDAGNFLATAHPWKWLERPPIMLSLVQNQAYIDLPSDLGTIVAYENGSRYGIQFVTFQALVEAREDGSVSPPVGAAYFAAVVWNVGSDGALAPRLELQPTPAAAASNAITLWHRAKWKDVVTSDEEKQYVSIPYYCEPLFKLILRDFARGYEEEDVAPLHQRLEVTMSSIVARTAMSRDGAIQPNYGSLMGGAGMRARAVDFLSGTVADPS